MHTDENQVSLIENAVSATSPYVLVVKLSHECGSEGNEEQVVKLGPDESLWLRAGKLQVQGANWLRGIYGHRLLICPVVGDVKHYLHYQPKDSGWILDMEDGQLCDGVNTLPLKDDFQSGSPRCGQRVELTHRTMGALTLMPEGHTIHFHSERVITPATVEHDTLARKLIKRFFGRL